MTTEPSGWERALLLAQSGDDLAALDLAHHLIAHDPGPEAFEIAASLSALRGDTDVAADLYRRGLTHFPESAVLAINAARLFRDHLKGVDEALTILDRYCDTHPDEPAASHARVETLRIGGWLEAAEKAAELHIAHFPAHGGGYLTLALVRFGLGLMIAALDACGDAVRFPKQAARACEIRANAHVALGDAYAAMTSYREALQYRPDPELHSRLLMSMMYCDRVPVDEINAETQSWVGLHMSGIQSRSHWPHLDLEAGRPLRVGFLASDFRQCSTPHLAFPLWAHMPERWEVTLYDNAPSTDEWAERFRAASADWRDISALDDEEVCDVVIEDKIDVLFDLNGHTLGGRPGVFHRKPAPIQIAWLDFVGTTGLKTYNAIIGDVHHIPLADQPFYTEPIRHVRDNLYRYHPPEDAPPVGPLPALKTGSVTFGCFNSAYKLSPSVIDLWSIILTRLPTSTLLLNSREYACSDTRDRLRDAFVSHGIAGSRIDLRCGAQTPRDLMASYAEVDIALDPFPYSGGLTTIEALFMGVPVISMPGDRFGSRHSMAHLRTVGLDDWIAGDPDAYVALAVDRAQDLARLGELRRRIRDQVLQSNLCNGGRLARDLDAIVSKAWTDLCHHLGKH